jgi:hypothetical protein
MKKNFSKLIFAGVIAFNLSPRLSARLANSSAGVGLNSTVSGHPRLQAAVQNFKTTRAIFTGQVTAIGSSTITVGNNGTSIQVDINSTTHFRRKFWGKSSLSEISIGDTVNVIGKRTNSMNTEVTASTIRDISIQKRNGTFFGTVISLTSGGFVVNTIHRNNETVTIGSAKITDRKGNTLSASGILVGDKIRVTGMWDNNAKTITEVTKIKDFSQPLKASPSTSR